MPSQVATTTAGSVRCYIPKAGTVTAIYGSFVTGGTHTATSTLNFRLNDTTDTLIASAALNNSAVTAFSNPSLSVTVIAGDFFEIKWTNPAWTNPNPNNVRMSLVVYIE
jgi:hypothetical protein